MIGIVKVYVDYYLGLVFQKRRKPRTLQFPITSKCNSRCLTCNIWKFRDRNDVDASKLKGILSNPFFSEIRGVGLNGGEPTLHNNIIEVFKAVLTLPKLESITLISNCINDARLLSTLRVVYPFCKEKNVSLHLQISIDGVGDVHNKVRGINVSFERSKRVLDELCKNRGEYLDYFDIGCTISQANVDYLAQFEEYFSNYDVPIYYHLAVPNKRIHNYEDTSFSVIYDKHSTQMAKEFFLKRVSLAKGLLERMRCLLIFLYLDGQTKKRLFLCNYLYQDITINECLDTFLCATASEKVGNLLDGIPSNSMYNQMAREVRKSCDTCIHYANLPNLRGVFLYYLYNLKTFKWLYIIKLKLKLL